MNHLKLQIIGLTGPAGVGKDTVGGLLYNHAGYRPIAFADKLRNEIAAAFLVSVDQLLNRETKSQPMEALALRHCTDAGFELCMIKLHQARNDGTTLDMAAPRSPRQITQWWGTEYRRAQDPDYFVRPIRQRITHMHNAGICSKFAITDVRFPNEAALVHLFGGQVWPVERPGIEVAPGAHTSETTGAELHPDAVVDNSGDYTYLRERVMELVWGLESGLKGVKVQIAPIPPVVQAPDLGLDADSLEQADAS